MVRPVALGGNLRSPLPQIAHCFLLSPLEGEAPNGRMAAVGRVRGLGAFAHQACIEAAHGIGAPLTAANDPAPTARVDCHPRSCTHDNAPAGPYRDSAAGF